jgi:CheY-like chemotaxis protein
MGDSTQLHQVIMNLCTNAYHAMEKTGGKLNIVLSQETIETPGSKKAGLPEGKYLKLTITDSGHGISPDIHDKIFDPFFTTKEQGKGTGMGLATVHGIMKSIGGAVSFTSSPGSGTRFNLFFPRIEANEEPLQTATPALPRGNETILLVDDDKSVLEMTAETLESLGYNVVAINDSTRVESLFKKNPDKIDLLLTDHMMPGITGNNLAKKILEIRPGLPVIVYTGFSGIITGESATDSGITKLLIKPVCKKALAEAIRECFLIMKHP